MRPNPWPEQFESELRASVNSLKEMQGLPVRVVFCLSSWNSTITVFYLLLSEIVWHKVRQWAFWISMIRGGVT